MKKALIGYQLYSAREDASRDLAGVLKQLKALGYDAVEFAGFYGHTADEIRVLLDEAGLAAVSDHVPYAVIEKDMFAVISDHVKIGCRCIAIPFLDEEHRPGQPGFAEVLRLRERLQKAGLVRDDTRYILNHLSHMNDMTHAEWERFAAPHGIEVAYDGLKVVCRP